MNNRKENEQSCIVMNKKEGASCITTRLHRIPCVLTLTSFKRVRNSVIRPAKAVG